MTLLGGQAFNFDFDPSDGFYYGFTQDKVIKLKNDNDKLFWQTFPENDNIDFLKSYLRLDVNYPKIINTIQKDKYIKSAVKKYPDIRLLKQDFEQTLLSFLISSNNNIRSIRTIIRKINQKFGKKNEIDGKEIFLFPKTETIADAKLEDLLECKLGFRGKFLKACAKQLLETNLHKKIHNMTEKEARNSLLEIKGVGEKIADCVLVFGLGFDNVTPLDVWAKRVLIRFYKLNPKMKYNDMQVWLSNYFGNYTSWAGQFLYEYIRNENM